jgi:transposase
MEELTLEHFYEQSLGLAAPWRVAKVVIDGESKEVRIRVECAAGEAWGDPETGERAEIKDWQERTWRHLDTCEYHTIISARVPRVVLSDGSTMTVRVPWAEPGGRFTKRFESRVIAFLQQCRTVRGAARLARITDDQADGVMARAVARGLLRRKEQPLKHIGLDEKAIAKGQRYATIFNDLSDPEGARVIEVVPERTQEAATGLLQSLPPEQREQIEAVAIDMWPAYIKAVEEVLPKADIVFDRFHVKKHLCEAVDKIRRQEHRELSAAGNLILKGSKFLWLKTHGDMRLKAAREFRALLVQDLQTGTAWALKENFDHFWSYRQWGRACRFMDQWMETVFASGLGPLAKAAEMIGRHAEGILNYIYHRITNAASEGINSTIQSLKHAARGLPVFKTFRTRVLFFLGKLDLTPA